MRTKRHSRLSLYIQVCYWATDLCTSQRNSTFHTQLLNNGVLHSSYTATHSTSIRFAHALNFLYFGLNYLHRRAATSALKLVLYAEDIGLIVVEGLRFQICEIFFL